MRKEILAFIALLSMMGMTSLAYAQRVTDDYVTELDIEVRFLGAESSGADQWHNPPLVEPPSYSTEPLAGYHKTKTKLGPQKWEFELQTGMPIFEKCIAIIRIDAVPNGFRIMELRVRIRSDREGPNGTQVAEIGDWSVPGSTRIIGRTSNPFLVE